MGDRGDVDFYCGVDMVILPLNLRIKPTDNVFRLKKRKKKINGLARIRNGDFRHVKAKIAKTLTGGCFYLLQNHLAALHNDFDKEKRTL